MLFDLDIHTKFSAYSKKEGAERLPQTIKISRSCKIAAKLQWRKGLLKIKTS